MTIIKCAAFENRLAEFLEGDLSPELAADMEAHAATCESCAALLEDMKRIARLAGNLPILEPERDLWPEIASRIEAPVVRLERPGSPRTRGISWQMAAAAAAVLIAVTATGTLRLSHSSREAPLVTAESPDDTPTATREPAVPASTTVQLPVDSAVRPSMQVREANTPVRQAGTRSITSVDPVSLLTSVYAQDIASLGSLLDQRRNSLDSNTVAIIEKNLRVIDEAIEQSREALLNDPNSAFLADQLNGALGQKVQLLRTVTRLQASS